MSVWVAIFIGILQGATELFPVSSLGHAVVLPSLLHWSVTGADSSFLPYLVLLHLGTAGALLLLYRDEWLRIIRGFVQAAVRGRVETPDQRLAMLLLVGTIPAGTIGFFLEKPIRGLFRSPRTAAFFLIVNGGVLVAAELLRRRAERRARLRGVSRVEQEQAFRPLEDLPFRSALLVGLCQAGALLPGISRSGTTMAGGLVAGLRHREAARFSFLLATPIIAAAGVLEVPGLFGKGVPLGTYLLGALLSAAAAYASARFLLRYFRSGRLDPYAAYCAAAGILALVLLR